MGDEQKHTPGPWTALEAWPGHWTISHGDTAKWVIRANKNDVTAILSYLNASDDLVEACRAIDEDWSQDMIGLDAPESDFLADSTRAIWRKIRAALKKAGEV